MLFLLPPKLILFALFVVALLYTFVPDVLITGRLYTSPMGVLDICESCKKFFVTLGVKMPKRRETKTLSDSPREFSDPNPPADTLPEEQPGAESASEAEEIHS